jgi:RNA polymerase sigma-70 factor, ECF subfamily
MQSEPKQNPSLNSLNDNTEFENLFTKWFKGMQGYAFSILRDENAAEEIVQQVFYTIWVKQLHREVKGSIKAYLYKSVYNQCMNYLKHQKHQINHHLHVAYHQKNNVDDAAALIETKEAKEKIREALNTLPEQCRTIFYLSRFEELRYREIAAQLGLSVKTVEAQMSKALKKLRNKLSHF